MMIAKQKSVFTIWSQFLAAGILLSPICILHTTNFILTLLLPWPPKYTINQTWVQPYIDVHENQSFLLVYTFLLVWAQFWAYQKISKTAIRAKQTET